MCILHNLSYRLDAEVPTRYRQLEYNTRNNYTEKSSTGCFSNRGDKMMVSDGHHHRRARAPSPSTHQVYLPRGPLLLDPENNPKDGPFVKALFLGRHDSFGAGTGGAT